MGLQLRQLSQPEVAVGQLGMGNDKVGLGHAPLAVAHDVQVERARRSTARRGPGPRCARSPGRRRAAPAARAAVSSRTIWLRYGGCVHRRRAARSPRRSTRPRARVSGSAARAARAAREVPGAVAEVAAERHVRAFGGGDPSSGLHREVPRDALEVGGHLAQLADGPLEVGLARCAASAARCASASVSLRVRGGAGRDPLGSVRSARRPRRSCSAAVAAIAWACRPASPVVPTMASSACAASALSSSTPATASRPALHLADDAGDLVGDLLQQRAAPRRAAWRLCAARSRTSSATTANPRPSRPGARGLDGRVERDQVGQVGDLADRADEAR